MNIYVKNKKIYADNVKVVDSKIKSSKGSFQMERRRSRLSSTTFNALFGIHNMAKSNWTIFMTMSFVLISERIQNIFMQKLMLL